MTTRVRFNKYFFALDSENNYCGFRLDNLGIDKGAGGGRYSDTKPSEILTQLFEEFAEKRIIPEMTALRWSAEFGRYRYSYCMVGNETWLMFDGQYAPEPGTAPRGRKVPKELSKV